MGDPSSFTSEDAAGLQLSPRALCAVVTVALVLIGVCRKVWGYVPILDGANLIFHEAGHPIYGIFGSTLALWGGTLGQLTFPVVVAVMYWRRQQMTGVALGAIWFFENGLNIAPYVADARARALPLVGGMDHDWFNILFSLDALPRDTAIARTIVFLSWAGLLAVWVWSFWRWQFPKR
jgi:hypothetical protein